MKNLLILLFISILPVFALAQNDKDVNKATNYDLYTGLYQVNFLANRKFNIYREGDKLIIELAGQGRTDLLPMGNNRFKANHVKPTAMVEFIPGSNGAITALTWTQQSNDQEWNKVSEKNTDTSGSHSPLFIYTGKYKPKGNAYLVYSIGIEGDHLTGNLQNEDKIKLYRESADYYVLKDSAYWSGYRFIKDASGDVTKMIIDQHGSLECTKVSPSLKENASAKHNFYNRTNFTHADTLLGQLSPVRTCYDVLFYHLDITVLPATKSIKGSNMIRFKSVNDFDVMQVDLFANMKINKIIFHNRELSYKRDADAVFIQFPAQVLKNTIDEIQIFYEGEPQVLDLAMAHSGWIWLGDKNGNPWIETVSQGSGASLWWPCKDHLSDKPDSMQLSVTVNNGLTAIANGKKIATTALPNNQTRFDWYVSYPINTYDAAIYIGDYVNYSEMGSVAGNTAAINYYCLKDNLPIAKAFFTNVKPVLDLYQQSFGGYPFSNDGFAIVESAYPMEHQSAVSMGSIYSPPNSNQFDSAGLLNTLWHEIAHEWWGNSVTCKDYADFWIHESFATYAELLARKTLRGQQSYQKAVNDTKPDNREPIIGFYDVNDFHMGDVYSKGSLMLTTLQHVVNNDSGWFAMLRGIQQRFKYQSVTTEDIVAYINESLKADYTYFFNEYLRYAAIPVLVLKFNQTAAGLTVTYKWQANQKDFRMPVKVSSGKKEYDFIYPTTAWKSIQMPGLKEKDFTVDKNDFYIGVQVEQNQ